MTAFNCQIKIKNILINYVKSLDNTTTIWYNLLVKNERAKRPKVRYNMEIYVVMCKNKNSNEWSVSTEGYAKYGEAVAFVKSRKGKPEIKDNRMMWVSESYEYYIKVITIHQ